MTHIAPKRDDENDILSSKINTSESYDRIKSTMLNVCLSGTYLVTSDSMLNYIDEIGMYRKFNVKSFPGAKIDDKYHYLILLLDKKTWLMILHVDTNNAVDIKSSEVVQKLLKLKEFVNGKTPECKIVISRPIKRTDETNATEITDEVVMQLQELNIDILNKEILQENTFGKNYYF